MHIIGLAVGSRGDVFPVLSILQEMSTRGHRASLLADWGYEDFCLSSKVDFHALSTAAEHAMVRQNKSLFASRYAALFVKRHCINWNATILTQIGSMNREEVAIIASNRPNLWADQMAQRMLGVPALRLNIDLPGNHETPPGLPYGPVQRRLEAGIHRAWRSTLGEMGVRAGFTNIPRTRRANGASRLTALWPRWLATEALSSGAADYLGFMPTPIGGPDYETVSAHEVVVMTGTDGTTAGWDHVMLKAVGSACRALRLSGIAVGGGAETLAACVTEGLSWSQFARLDHMLRGARAIIHHGGVGTFAAAAEAGVPQIAIPRVFGQFNNSYWFRRTGICRVARASEWTGASATTQLDAVLNNQSLRSRCEAFAQQNNRKRSLACACDHLEATFAHIRKRLPHAVS